MRRLPALLLALSASAAAAPSLRAQEMEPRRWTHLPVGTNIAGFAYAWTEGDLGFDPVLEITEAELSLHSAIVSYNRYFALADMTGRLDVQLPYQHGHWSGLLSGVPQSVSREGLDDPRIRLSLSFAGAPALEGPDFARYRAEHEDGTVAGVAVAVRVPLGEYLEDKLINLGENRFSFEFQAGAVRDAGPWSFELTGSVFLFTDNTDFAGGRRLAQDPMFAVQTHVTRSFEAGFWLSAGASYGTAGETEIDGVAQDDARSNLLYGLSLGFSPFQRQSVRIGYIRQVAFNDLGLDGNHLLLTWGILF